MNKPTTTTTTTKAAPRKRAAKSAEVNGLAAELVASLHSPAGGAKVVGIDSLRKAAAKAAKPIAEKAEPKPVAANAPRKAVPNAERRNEMTHAEGAAAVARFTCSSCGSEKGTRCLARSGEQTNHVHSARMQAFDAAQAAPPPTARTRKAAMK